MTAATVAASTDGRGAAISGSQMRLDCDLIAVSGGFAPASSLLLQAGARAEYDDGIGPLCA